MMGLSRQIQRLVYEFVFQVRRLVEAERDGAAPVRRVGGDFRAQGDVLTLKGRSFSDLEQAILAWALRNNGWSARRAARALSISRSTFHDRVVRYGLVARSPKRSRIARLAARKRAARNRGRARK